MKQLLLRGLCLWPLFLSAQLALGQDRFILRTAPTSVGTVAANHGLTITIPPNSEGVAGVENSDTRTSDQVLKELRSDPTVVDAESDSGIAIPEGPNGVAVSASTAAVPTSLIAQNQAPCSRQAAWSAYLNQPAAVITRMGNARALPLAGPAIVAVIDSGIDPTYPLLQGSLVLGYDFVNNVAGGSEWIDLDPVTAGILQSSTSGPAIAQVNQSTAAILDQSTAAILDTSKLPPAFGHGTMVAGIIHLVAPSAQIMPLKVFKRDGTGDLATIVQAVYYAVDNGARVINMSFSITNLSVELMKALDYATAHGVVCVASVGNDASETIVYPAAFQNVIGVASTDNQDNRSTFSNYGAALARMAAPGEGIVTIYPGGGYAVVSGTSFAAPFVSGGAALMVQRDYDMTQDEATQAFSNAHKLTVDLGWGRLDLFQSVKSVGPLAKSD